MEGPQPSDKVFSFGNNRQLKSLGRYKIPGKIHGRDIAVMLDVKASDIPLLLSKSAMKTAGIKIDFGRDEIEAFDMRVPLSSTESGHLILRLQQLPEEDKRTGKTIQEIFLARAESGTDTRTQTIGQVPEIPQKY